MKAHDLKNSILQMAVQGKLVPQDHADEPASVLLERIREERAVLIKQKKIKAPKGGESVIYRDGGSWHERRGKSDPVCIDDEIPFDIPESWEWCRGSELYQLLDGEKFDGVPWINMDARYLRGKGEAKVLFKGRYVSAGTRMILVDGENSGEVFVAPHEGCLGSTFKELWLSCGIDPDYANKFLQFNQRLLRNSKTGSAIPHLNKTLFFNLLAPLPPIAEQQRIVERIDELMPLVEEYGELENAREALDAALPDRLRKSILQMAVQGKLVEQDPADEPASALLERIRVERAEFVKQKKIKAPKGGESVIYRDGGSWCERRGKSEPVCIDDEIPFEIPESWEWTRLDCLTLGIGDGLHGTPTYCENGDTPFINGGNLIDGVITITPETKFVDSSEAAKYYIGISDNAILMSINGSIGHLAIYRGEQVVLGKSACYVNLVQDFSRQYCASFMSTEYFLNDVTAKATKTTIKNVSLKAMRNIVVPIPPLAEQRRIAERVNELISLIKE